MRVLIADDHPLLLQGLHDLLSLKKKDCQVVGVAGNGYEALQMIQDLSPDIAVLDIEMPYMSGLSVAEECGRKQIKTRFIILSYHKEPEFVNQARGLNIAGYLLKEDTSTEIFRCLDAVLAGGTYFSPSILASAVTFVDKSLVKLEFLSPSEKKILKLIAERLTSQDIADKLHISERTVEKHRSNIINKLGLSGQSNGLLLWAQEHKTMLQSL